MHPVLLGTLLGLANVVAAAILFVIADKDSGGAFVLVFAYGILPGIGAGAVLGMLAGGMRSCSRVFRFIVLAILAALAVTTLGVFFGLPGFIAPALVPTMIGCGVLERYSRTPVARTAGGRSSVGLAMGLGAVTMLVIMAGVFNHERDASWFFEGYLPWGLGCGLGLAAPFGFLADWSQHQPVWRRRSLLLGAALTLVCGLAVLVRAEHMIALASIPTVAGCLVLERYSRMPARVPVAIASPSFAGARSTPEGGVESIAR